MNLPQTSILYPCFVMVVITAVVWFRMYFDRIKELRVRRIRPQKIATTRQATNVLGNISASENFSNLFEMPVLFYMLCILIYVTNEVSQLVVAGAWSFVALRALHSLIHCTYNLVVHRFIVYVLSTFILFVTWGVFIISINYQV